MIILTELNISNLLDTTFTISSELFEGKTYPFEILSQIGTFIRKKAAELDSEIFEKRGEDIYISRSAKIAESAHIAGPCIIDENAEIRHCAFIRGNAIIGKNSVVGNSTELKNVILFDYVQVPHYNYVGDSILGYRSHMGAGAITSNVKSDKSLVTVKLPNGRLETGLKKFGAILGDNVEIGCNTVLNPGTIIGRNTNIYPLSSVRGYVPSNSIYKAEGRVVEKF